MSDQRHCSRTTSSSELEVVDIESGIGFSATTLDVSEEGLAFRAPMEPALGADMEVKFVDTDGKPTEFKVVRIESKSDGYTVAGTFRSR